MPALRDGSTAAFPSLVEAGTLDDDDSRSSIANLRHRMPDQQTPDPGSFNTPTISRLLETYFTTWHPRWPVLHRQSFDWQTAPWDLVWVVFMTAAKLQSHQSPFTSALQEEIATLLKEEIEQTLQKDLSVGVAANVEEPGFLLRMQTYVLYVLFVLYFELDVDYVSADRLVAGIVQLLNKSGIFRHPSLHEESTLGSVARITQESWRMFAHPMIETSCKNANIIQDHRYGIPFRCLCINLEQKTP